MINLLIGALCVLSSVFTVLSIVLSIAYNLGALLPILSVVCLIATFCVGLYLAKG